MDFLKNAWNKWIPISQIIGNFMGQVMMTVFYLFIIFPLGVITRLFNDPLKIRKSILSKQISNFDKWEHPKQSLEESKKQY